MLFSRVIEGGVGMGLIAVVAPASIGMWFPVEKQGVPNGLWATWVPVGSVIMFILAPALAAAFGWQSIWWFGRSVRFAGFHPGVALYAHAAANGSTRAPPQVELLPGNHHKLAYRKALSNPSIWLLGAMFGFFNLALIALNTFFPTFLFGVRGYSMASASFTVSLIMITVLFSAPLAGVLSRTRSAPASWYSRYPSS